MWMEPGHISLTLSWTVKMLHRNRPENKNCIIVLSNYDWVLPTTPLYNISYAVHNVIHILLMLRK